MYIIFNKDGSIKESQLNDYINQYSDGVNTIDIAIVGTTFDNYTASVTYTFSNGETATDSGTPINYIKTSSGVYTGWRFTLHSAFTQYSGDLLASFIGITNSTSKTTLFSYPVTLNVNATSSARQVELTWEQFKSLEQAQADYQLQYSSTNVRGYYLPIYAISDTSSFATNQLIISTDESGKLGQSYELYFANDSSDTRTLTKVAIGQVANRPYFVYTQTNSSPADTIQDVGTGLASRLYDADGNIRVSYGSETNDYGFFVNVLDKSANYDGTISLGAKNYKFAYDSAVDVFSSDGNTTAIKSPMGSASVELANGDATIKATNTTLKANKLILKSTDDYEWVTFNGITANFSADVKIDLAFISTAFLTHGEVANEPTSSNHLANKSYVDQTADSKAAEYANIEQSRAQTQEQALQDAIDAINASQNFVATYATEKDLPSAPTAGVLDGDCALVLKDSTKNNQSTVYKWVGAPYIRWEYVGELGDYYTKAYINAEFAKTNGNVAYYRSQADSYAKKVDDYANATDDKIAELGKVVDTAKDAYLASTPTFVETSSSTEESDVTPTLVGLFAETGSSTTISE